MPRVGGRRSYSHSSPFHAEDEEMMLRELLLALVLNLMQLFDYEGSVFSFTFFADP